MAQGHAHRKKDPLKMEVEIRRVKTGDEEALAYVNTESWKAAFSDILGKETLDRIVSYEKAVSLYKGLIEEGKGNGYLLLLDHEPHCMAWWDKARDEDMADKAELICIHSLSNNWGKGYGSMMMERILADIRDAGYLDVVLWVFTDNDRARRFYEKHGFRATDSVRELLGVEEVRYHKSFQEEMNSLYQDHSVTLAKQEDRLYLLYQERSCLLSSNSYEPCLYIGLSEGRQITVHNSFETREIEKAAKSKGSIRMITGHAYDIQEICRLLVLAIELGQESIDISYLEGRRFIRILENLHAYSPETAADLSVYGLKNVNIMEGFIHAKRIAATKDGWYYITKPYNGISD